ncbi:c-type cytochrome [Rubeoparvulum massiliense]|uniref:c-type cytochrome n=1 Tax=Rubeoparvulum massiliense TaxID=1631346 RepID=UPI00065DCE53|nr:cytochrome c [Rubeoparvulum massiliense]
MKKVLLTCFALILSIGLLSACSSGGDKATDAPQTETSAPATALDGEKLVKGSSCLGCHGGNLEGQGAMPALNDVGSRLSQDEIYQVIRDGRGAMPAQKGNFTDEELQAMAAWLAEQK